MTDADYQKLYESNKMNPKDKLEWERYLSWKAYHNSFLNKPFPNNSEIVDLLKENKVFTIGDNLPKSKKDTTRGLNIDLNNLKNKTLNWWDDFKSGLDSKVKTSTLADLKNVVLKQSEHPGFQFHSAGTKDPKAGYYSVDETSDFWQTDAGYDKAMQTWGEKPGWVKPGYRPKKKELDIDAIKKWFKPSK
jgi:hypothetical protein